MPLYEFQCEKCGCCFERIVFESDETEITCPDCHTEKVRKLISCASFLGGSNTEACAGDAPSGLS